MWTGLDQMIMRMKGNPEPSIKDACAVLDGFEGLKSTQKRKQNAHQA